MRWHSRRATFDGEDLYSGLVEKAAALAHALVMGHGFVDGNKRVGHASLEVFLLLNDVELIESDVDLHEAFWLSLAAGEVSRAELAGWLEPRVRGRAEPA